MATQKQCPYCESIVKDLRGHKVRKHPEEYAKEKAAKETVNNDPPETPETPQGEPFDLKPPENPAPANPAESGYHCIGCGGSVSLNENPCPKCGSELNWAALSNA